MSNEHIREAMLAGVSILGGGFGWKVINLLSNRRKDRVETDSISMNTAIKMVQTLNQEMTEMKKELKEARELHEEEVKKNGSMRLEITDLKITLKSIYSQMKEHMKTCSEPLHLPHLPESIKDTDNF